MALLVAPSDTQLTDVSEPNDSEHDESLSIKQIMVDTEKNLHTLIRIDNSTFDRFVDELELKLLKQLNIQY